MEQGIRPVHVEWIDMEQDGQILMEGFNTKCMGL